MSFSEVIQTIKPSIVMILAETGFKRLPFVGEYIVRDKRPAKTGSVWSKGTGFVVKAEEGIVATAHHIVKDCPSQGLIEIHPLLGAIGAEKATVLAMDADADVALLKTESLNLPSITLGQYSDGIDGNNVAFTGFPLNLNFHITHRGIISSKTRIRYDKALKPVDGFTVNAFVNRGNSGGPLFLIDSGRVIGVINARQAFDPQQAMILLPPNYKPIMKVGGVDPIGLSVETYNRAVALIGDIGQVGIGLSSSIDYIRAIMP